LCRPMYLGMSSEKCKPEALRVTSGVKMCFIVLKRA
jgi:hypothetical protein